MGGGSCRLGKQGEEHQLEVIRDRFRMMVPQVRKDAISFLQAERIGPFFLELLALDVVARIHLDVSVICFFQNEFMRMRYSVRVEAFTSCARSHLSMRSAGNFQYFSLFTDREKLMQVKDGKDNS